MHVAVNNSESLLSSTLYRKFLIRKTKKFTIENTNSPEYARSGVFLSFVFVTLVVTVFLVRHEPVCAWKTENQTYAVLFRVAIGATFTSFTSAWLLSPSIVRPIVQVNVVAMWRCKLNCFIEYNFTNSVVEINDL